MTLPIESFTLEPRRIHKGAAAVCICAMLAVAVVVIARLAGAADVLDRDQPRTMSYIMDTLLHGRWVLPRDMFYEPATKPPLYNWLAAPVVAMAGAREWAFKWPSLAAALVVFVLCLKAPRWFAQDEPNVPIRGEEQGEWHDGPGRGLLDPRTIGWLAAAITIVNAPTMRTMYLCRPEMLHTAFLTGGWLLATLGLRPVVRHRAAIAIGFWACVAGVAMSKGPAALLLVIYPIILAIVIYRRPAVINRLGWWWGLPLVLAMVGAWLYVAYRQAPNHVLTVIMKNEFAGPILYGNRDGSMPRFWVMPVAFLVKFPPWSLLVLLLPVLTGFRRLLSPALAPAVLWLTIIVIFFSLPAGKRIEYLLPAYIPAAILASHSILRLIGKWRAITPVACAMFLVTAACLATYQVRYSPEGRLHSSDREFAFIREVRPLIGDAPVLVLVPGKQSIASLLGRSAGDGPSAQDFAAARWVIAPRDQRFDLRFASAPLPQGLDAIAKRPLVAVALYDMGAPQGPGQDQLRLWYAQMLECAAKDHSYGPIDARGD